MLSLHLQQQMLCCYRPQHPPIVTVLLMALPIALSTTLEWPFSVSRLRQAREGGGSSAGIAVETTSVWGSCQVTWTVWNTRVSCHAGNGSANREDERAMKSAPGAVADVAAALALARDAHLAQQGGRAAAAQTAFSSRAPLVRTS